MRIRLYNDIHVFRQEKKHRRHGFLLTTSLLTKQGKCFKMNLIVKAKEFNYAFKASI